MNSFKKQSNINNRALITSVLIVFTLITTGAWLWYSSNQYTHTGSDQAKQGPSKQEVEEERKTDSAAKKDFAESNPNQSNPGVEVPIPTSSDSIEITASKDGGVVTVSTKLHGFSSGTCAITITNSTDGAATSKTASIIYQPEFSTCAGFDIPVSDLGSGTWMISLEVRPAGGNNLTKETKIQV